MPFTRDARSAARRRREREWELAWLESPTPDAPGHRASRLWVPVILSLLVQVPAVFVTFPDAAGAFRTGPNIPVTLSMPIALALSIIGPLALIGARRFPGPVVLIVSIAATVDLLVATSSFGPPFIALGFAIVSAIVRGARVWAWISVAACWIGAVILGASQGIEMSPGRIAAVTLGVLVLIGIGEAVRTRREGFDQIRRTIADRRRSEIEAERIRIARELHDVLAHSLSQINVQAGVGLHLMSTQPEKAAEALANIKSSSKAALDEVRTVLGILRADDRDGEVASLAPEADLSRLEKLVDSVTAQGVDVVIDNTIGSVPSSAVQLALYRIVQESLTNVVRHADATTARVTLSETRTDYILSIRDDGHGGSANPGSADGRGLLGMRERAELLGGTLHTASTAGVGFDVRAVIPREPHHPAAGGRT